ncbi:MAG: hypothetical protein AAF483_06000 [Planctomycetota bacterium]
MTPSESTSLGLLQGLRKSQNEIDVEPHGIGGDVVSYARFLDVYARVPTDGHRALSPEVGGRCSLNNKLKNLWP